MEAESTKLKTVVTSDGSGTTSTTAGAEDSVSTTNEEDYGSIFT